jgi:hypothetical protein
MFISKGRNCIKPLLVSAEPQNVGMTGVGHDESSHWLDVVVPAHC